MHSLTSNQVKATKKSALKADSFVFYGAKEIRTPDPLHAMQVLYQLSYNPMRDSILHVINTKVKLIWAKIEIFYFRVFCCDISTCQT